MIRDDLLLEYLSSVSTTLSRIANSLEEIAEGIRPKEIEILSPNPPQLNPLVFEILEESNQKAK